MTLKRRHILQLMGGLAALPLVSTARGQVYPARGVTIVVGFPPAGPLDIAARTIAPWLSASMAQPFAVENRPGASGNNATSAVVRAPPDGHTLLLCGPVHTINTTLFPYLDFNFTRDIAPVAGIARVPLVVEVHPSVPARTLPELIAYARTHPGRVRVAYAGNGTPQHLAIELFKVMAGVDMALVPYLGSAPALDDLLAGRVDAMFDPIPSSLDHVRAGRLVPLAVTGAARLATLPDVPIAQDFVPGFDAGSWFGLGAPRGTPSAVIERIAAAVHEGLADAVVRTRLAEIGATPMPLSVTEFATFIERETRTYARLIEIAGIRLR